MSPVRARAIVLAGCAVTLAALCAATTAGAAQSITVDRARIATQLGRSFEFRSTIRNAGPGTATGLVAHLSVLNLQAEPYVDPEDWSPQRVVAVDSIPAGDARTLTWRMTAVNAGTFAVYVTVLAKEGGGAPPPNSPPIAVRVAERRTLDAGGIGPLALGIPALLGVLALSLRLRRHRG
jgi:hypothetical protein